MKLWVRTNWKTKPNILLLGTRIDNGDHCIVDHAVHYGQNGVRTKHNLFGIHSILANQFGLTTCTNWVKVINNVTHRPSVGFKNGNFSVWCKTYSIRHLPLFLHFPHLTIALNSFIISVEARRKVFAKNWMVWKKGRIRRVYVYGHTQKRHSSLRTPIKFEMHGCHWIRWWIYYSTRLICAMHATIYIFLFGMIQWHEMSAVRMQLSSSWQTSSLVCDSIRTISSGNRSKHTLTTRKRK